MPSGFRNSSSSHTHRRWTVQLRVCDLLFICTRIPPVAGFKRIVYSTIYSIVKESIMGTLAANDLKTKGIKAIEEALLDQPEALVSVRGQVKYVVMSQEHYQYLRECELEAALAESKADLSEGRFVKETVAAHLKRLKQLNRTAA